MTDTICPTCGYPTQDGAYTCEECLTGFGNFIGSVPALEEQLLITMTGERSPIPGYSAPSSEAPLPYDVRAGDLLAELRNELVGWVRQCHEEGVRHSSPHAAYPEDTLGSMVDWLLWRVDGMAWVKWSPHAVRAAARLEERVMRAIDPVVSRTYLGQCECGAQVWLKDGETVGRCGDRGCGKTYPADEMRAKLEAELDDRLMTAGEIATATVIMAYPRSREWVTATIEQWGRRKRLIPRGERLVKGVSRPLYRYGEAKVLLERAAS